MFPVCNLLTRTKEPGRMPVASRIRPVFLRPAHVKIGERVIVSTLLSLFDFLSYLYVSLV
ncbi:hypothetical protein B1J93_18595 [Leptospira kirschneri serovar Pomona]|uniref:Uncharacterized protein n=1 Tax=Leptospira kirschneri serovar Pomona TaxID=561005 RepID=A0A1T1DHH1_9LEPT|nr:hypothetical protein B1J93_18595 [Leptospira kirschneri serovar Pomona]